MLKIDTHQHFWKYNPVRDAWITNDMTVLKKDYMPADLMPLLQQNNIEACIVVQSAQSKAENIFQLANAATHDFIKGVVGWVDLQSSQLTEELEYYSTFNKLKGFREILQGNNELMQSSAFRTGMGLLSKYDFTYDILIYAHQLKLATALVKDFPNQRFVLDHIAKPRIKEADISQWKKEIQQLAACDNVSCKISGMVTEADWRNWKIQDIIPYMDVVVEAFGSKRIMFGSDWPVCLTAASYTDAVNIARAYFSSFSKNEQELFWGRNALSFYQLN
jgi:L-fuconolactonase